MFGQGPEWQAPTQGTYEDYMGFTAKIQIDGANPNRSDLKIAAFNNGIVRGVGTSQIWSNDATIVMFKIYGDKNDVLNFKLYVPGDNPEDDRILDTDFTIKLDPDYTGTSNVLNFYKKHFVVDNEYDLSMTVGATVRINGVDPKRTDLELAAFCGDEVRGVAKAIYWQSQDMYYYELIVGGRIDGEEITYKLYDPIADVDLLTDYKTTFEDGSTIDDGYGKPVTIEFKNNPVARIGEEGNAARYFATLEAAVAAAVDGETILLLKDVTLTETLTIEKNITLDLNEKNVTLSTGGNMIKSNVTIKNGNLAIADVDTQTTANSNCFISTDVGASLTLDDIVMTGNGYTTYWAVLCAMSNSTAGSTINITNSTVTLSNEKGSAGGFIKDQSGADNYSQINISNSTLTLTNVSRGFTGAKVTLNDVDLTITGGEHGINGSELVIENGSNVSISNGAGRAITLNKFDASIITDSNVTISNMGEGGIRYKTANTLTVDASSTLSETIAHADVDNAKLNDKVVRGTESQMSTVKVEGGVTTVINPVSGQVAYRAYINDSDTREAIQVDLQNVNALISLAVKLYDANGNLLTTTTYKAGAVEAPEYLTCNIVLLGEASSSWGTVISAEKLTVDNYPHKAELVVDGNVINTFENILGNATDAAAYQLPAYKALGCVYKAASITRNDVTEYYSTIANANAATTDNDVVTILVSTNETIGVPQGNNVTFNAIEGVELSGGAGGSYYNKSVTFDGLTFKGGKGIALTAGVDDLTYTVKNCTFDDVQATAWKQGVISLNGNATVVVENNIITYVQNATEGDGRINTYGQQSVGIYTSNAAAVTISDNTITNVDGTGISSNSNAGKVDIKDNTVSAWGTGATAKNEGRAIRTSGGTEVAITGNVMIDNGTAKESFVKSTGFTTSLDASMNYWNGQNPVASDLFEADNTDPVNYVKNYYTDVDKQSLVTLSVSVAKVGDKYYQSVNEAINSAADGATVQLLPCTISEYIAPWATDTQHTSEKSITIVGAENYGTTLTGGMYLGYDDSQCREHNIVVNGINFTGKGILVAGQKNVVIENNKFSNITDCVADPGSANANAISVIGKNINATVTGNVIDGTASAGINLRDTKTVNVSGNIVTNTVHNSITVQNNTTAEGDKVEIKDNTLSNWGTGGEGRAVRIAGGATVSVNGNVMTKENAPEEFVKVTNATTVDASANYWNGVSPLTDGMFTGVEGDLVPVLVSYYTDVEKQHLVDLSASVAKIGEKYYQSLSAAFADAALTEELTTIELLPVTIEEDDDINTVEKTIKLPATLKNVIVKGADNNTSILKNLTIQNAQGGTYDMSNITFDGVVFDNSNIVLTGWRTGFESLKNLIVKNCIFRNIVRSSANLAAVHINVAADKAVNGFTFINNVIDGVTGAQNSGIYGQFTGEVIVKDNVINNVAFRPYVIQLTTDDGIADNFTVTGNTFSGSAAGRAQGLGNNDEGTDAVTLTVSNNIFKGITDAQQICYWNFNEATTTATLEKNYYDIDVMANPNRIYYNSPAQNISELSEMGIFPIYKGLKEDGTINEESLFDPVAYVRTVAYKTLAEAFAGQDGTIVLLENIELTEGVVVAADKTFTLDLNGKVVSGVSTAAATSSVITNNGNLTVQSSVEGGKITSFANNPDPNGTPAYANNTITNCGVLTLVSGTIENSTVQGLACYPIDNNSTIRDAIVNIKGGVVTGRGAIRQFANSETNKNEVNVTGGQVIGTSYAIWIQNPSNQNSKDVKAALNISNGELGKILLEASAAYDIKISGGKISEVAFWETDVTNPERNPSSFITGGTFGMDVTEFCAFNYVCTSNGDGTYGIEYKPQENNAFVIETLHELEAFRDAVNAGNTFEGETVVLSAGVDLNPTRAINNWEPIGTQANPFKGTFDGGNKTISNLNVDGGAYVGLFGYADNATIKNVKIENANVKGTDCVGVIAGNVYSTSLIDNCHVSGSIKVEGQTNVGGIVGKYYTKVKNCSVIGDGVATSYVKGVHYAADYEGDNIGGIMGHGGENNTFTNNTVKNITISGTRKVAGIVGVTDQNTDVVNCLVENVYIVTTATAEYAEANKTKAGHAPIVGSYTSADANKTYDGTVIGCTVKNVTFVNDNKVTASFGPITGGAREGMIAPSAGVTASNNNIYMSTITGTTTTGTTTNMYLMNAVAKIGTTEYYTLFDAVAAVQDGETTITMLRNTSEEFAIDNTTANITLDMAGNTLTGAITPSKANLTIENGTINNENASYSAIEINAGTLVLNDVKVTSKRHGVRIDGAVEATINGGEYRLSATSGTRHAVNVSGAANVTITDGIFVGPKGTTMDSGSAVCVQAGATVTIEGGDFSGGKTATLGVSGTMIVKGGTFDQDVTAYCADGYVCQMNADNKYEVFFAVAQIGETYYETIQEAVEAAENNNEIKLLANIEVTESLVVTKTITLDLNDKTITGTDNNTSGNFYLINVDKGNLTVKDSGTNGTITLVATTERNWSSSSVVIANNQGVLTVDSGTIQHLGGTSMAYAIDNLTNGTIGEATTIINGGNIKSTYFAIRQFANSTSTLNKLVVTGGTIEYTWMQSPNNSVNTAAIEVTGGSIAGMCISGVNADLELSVLASALGEDGIYGSMPAGQTLDLTDGVYTLVKAVAQVGENKFGSVIKALDYAITNNAAQVEIVSDSRELMPTDVYLRLNADLEITAAQPYTVKFYNNGTSYDFVVGSNNSNTLTFDENVTFQLEDRIIWLGYYGNDVDVVVNGTLAAYQIWHGADTKVTSTGTIKTTGEAFVMRRGATLTVDGGTVNASYFNILAGNIDAENANITCGPIWIANTGSYANEGNVNINIKSSTLTSGSNLKSSTSHADGVSINFENSVVTFTLHDGYAASEIDANTKLNVKGASANVSIKGLTNNGLVNVTEEAKLTLTGTVTNNGAMKLDATSVIYAPENLGVTIDDNDYDVVYENGAYQAVHKPFVAQVDGTQFTSLQAAIDAADGKTVVVLDNITLTETVTVAAGTTVTLDLNGKTVSAGATFAAKAIRNDGTLTINGNGGTIDISASTTESIQVVDNYGTLTINGGTYKGATSNFSYAIRANDANSVTNIVDATITTHFGAIGINKGVTTITDGKFEVTSQAGGHALYVANAEVTINGGEFIPYANGYSYAVLTNDANAKVSITGGTFKKGLGDPCVKALSGNIIITGGTFSTDVNGYCHEYYDAVTEDNITWTVEQVLFAQTTSLQGGWNWFSSYVDIDGAIGLSLIQSALGSNGVQIKNPETGRFSQYSVNPNTLEAIWSGSLRETSSSDIYAIRTLGGEEITHNIEIVSAKLDPADPSNTVTIRRGWNYVAYPLDVQLSVNAALGFTPTMGDVIKSKDQSSVYYGTWVGQLTNMIPGQGYMYQSNNSSIMEFNFEYPSTNNRESTVLNIEAIDYYWNVDAHNYSGNMTMIAMLETNDEIMQDGYEIAAFANGECRGTARPVYVESVDAYILVFTVNGEDVEELSFKCYDVNTGVEYNLNNRINYSNDAVVGSIDEPYMFNLDMLNIGETSVENISIYPNPTTTGREIQLQAVCDKVEVFNALGVKIAEYSNVDSIDAIETAGVYVIRLTIDNSARNCRLIVK